LTDKRAYFSNYGRCLDIYAPGVSIVSCSRTQGKAFPASGTSMAAPHVAGVAALLLQEDPWLTPAELVKRMLADATAGVVSDPGNRSPNLLLYTGDINERAISNATLSSAPSSAPPPSDSKWPELIGMYENFQYDGFGKNDYHYVVLKEEDGKLLWANRAGSKWVLNPVASNSDEFRTEAHSTYGVRTVSVKRDANGKVKLLLFINEKYERVLSF
jgi:subtilisin family serine protease